MSISLEQNNHEAARLTLMHIDFCSFHNISPRTYLGNWIYRMPCTPADTYSLIHWVPKGERVIYPNYMVRAAAVVWKRRGVKLALGALIVREGLLVGDCH